MWFPLGELLAGQEKPISATDTMTIKDTLALMVEHGVSQLSVVDASGRLIGLITEQELTHFLETHVEPTPTAAYRTGGVPGRRLKYTPLADWLRARDPNMTEAPMTFSDIEEIIGQRLPPSSVEYGAWWDNNHSGIRRSQADAWVGAGWEAKAVDRVARTLTFERITPTTNPAKEAGTR